MDQEVAARSAADDHRADHPMTTRQIDGQWWRFCYVCQRDIEPLLPEPEGSATHSKNP